MSEDSVMGDSIFKEDLSVYRDNLHKEGYAHLKGVLSDEFVAYLNDFYVSMMGGSEKEAQDWKISGKKKQFLFEFPTQQVAERFRADLAKLTGMATDAITVSERHLKVYDKNANPFPAPHKDRSASAFSIGFPVFLPQGSTVAVFPELDNNPNEEEHAVFMTDRDRPDLEDIYNTPECVMLNESVGDMVIFRGSALWHERVRGAGTAVLYLKCNEIGDDPLGENMFNEKQAEHA